MPRIFSQNEQDLEESPARSRRQSAFGAHSSPRDTNSPHFSKTHHSHHRTSDKSPPIKYAPIHLSKDNQATAIFGV